MFIPIEVDKMKKILTYLVLITILIGTLYAVKILFLPEYENALYGDRLEGIAKVKETNVLEVINLLNAEESIKEAKSRIQGKIINIDVKLTAEADINDSKKKIEDQIITLTQEVQDYYDVQVFVTKDIEDAKVYVIGYKNKLTTSIVWTN